MDLLLSARRSVQHALGKEIANRTSVRTPYEVYGDAGGHFAVVPAKLGKDSNVYSFGIGTNISFDLALIDRFGMVVHAFDPTPRSIRWLATQRLPSEFVVHDLGLAAEDGTLEFQAPENPEHVSFSAVKADSDAKDLRSFEVRRLGTLMKDLGHDSLDLLKMDVEGLEYEVIDSLRANPLPIKQIAVEFHHRWPHIGVEKTNRAIGQLRDLGYELFFVSEGRSELGFIHREAI